MEKKICTYRQTSNSIYNFSTRSFRSRSKGRRNCLWWREGNFFPQHTYFFFKDSCLSSNFVLLWLGRRKILPNQILRSALLWLVAYVCVCVHKSKNCCQKKSILVKHRSRQSENYSDVDNYLISLSQNIAPWDFALFYHSINNSRAANHLEFLGFLQTESLKHIEADIIFVYGSSISYHCCCCHSSEKLGAILSKHRSNQVTTHILPSLLGTISRKIPHRSVSLAILLGSTAKPTTAHSGFRKNLLPCRRSLASTLTF